MTTPEPYPRRRETDGHHDSNRIRTLGARRNAARRGALFPGLADLRGWAPSPRRPWASPSSATSSALRKAPVKWVPLGRVDRFSAGRDAPGDLRQPASASRGTAWRPTPASTSATRAATSGGRRDEGTQFLVLAVNCAHLGCPVAWFPQSGLFMCPCHGGVYYANGERASGPPPRGLFRCVWRVTRAGGSSSWRSRRRTIRPCRTPWNKA